ncbi:hypothetical protein [Streptantibioticus ferralitis]|uniref:Aminoglycoside phosphotransferase domain-containing protein n=1 Tax=Streptantibioticus ferralitis TaxID=236510 RepID=A0ABT5Z9Q8_9ACTN|nr:hypothetical protein [Streptantibioticus ferralitis]MDF2260576.1 hypothetical protein [Streptantibioticus ferralitis]
MNCTNHVGPLDGAARLRPDGWLARPLTRNRIQAEAQARLLLQRYHPQSAGPVRCLTARYRTAAFALGAPAQRLLKRHADQAAYLSEVLAYQLLDSEGVLPALLSSSDTSLSLVTEYVEERMDLGRPAVFEELVATVAAIHTAPARWHPAIQETMADWTVAAALDAPAPPWISVPHPWELLLKVVADAHGPDHVPVGHLDLKADHGRRHPDGHPVVIDVETLRPDLTGQPDLITLAHLARVEGGRLSPRSVRHLYRRCTSMFGAQWTDAALVRALTAFAEATGLRCLHGVER